MIFLRENLDYIVFGILGLMSFILIWYALERYFYYTRVKVEDFQDLEMLDVDLTRRLTTISIIGSNAPYIGLLGTVIGILITFWEIGQSGNISPSEIMVGLALALKATAAGLVVAIPAIMFYNGLLRKVDVLKSRWKSFQRISEHLG